MNKIEKNRKEMKIIRINGDSYTFGIFVKYSGILHINTAGINIKVLIGFSTTGINWLIHWNNSFCERLFY
jgi:hypothetical protein